MRVELSGPDGRTLIVTFYYGEHDGKPVVQIDGDADFRVNVNDGPIWDADSHSHEHMRCRCVGEEVRQ